MRGGEGKVVRRTSKKQIQTHSSPQYTLRQMYPLIDTLLACGGLAKNPLFLQQHADIIGCSIILPRENESVLLGAAILGAVAAKRYSSLIEAMKALNAAGQVIHPSEDPKVKKYHDAKYHIFRELYQQQVSQRSLMAQALA
ncbi:hypothetical protein Patl1_14334 [Pistacia atlantica]|uniref:Uncharacterized protein n=1 Tax=Pistacia atlantica TaxID=434234 RepID=A0ACC1AVP2_9ROSI|nr:hypothetical protein Patl1_14334 [Pistacia atlantica]